MIQRRGSGFGGVAVAVAVLSVLSLDARLQDSADVSARLDQWLGAVLAHTPGELDDAAVIVGPWPQRDLNALVGDLQKHFRFFQEGRAPSAFVSIFRRDGLVDQAAMNRTLKLAALLHADVGVLHRTSAGYALPPDDRSIRILSDGRQVGIRGGTPHWAFARALLDAVQPRPVKDDYVRLWYRATTAFFYHWSDYAEGPPHLHHARTLFPDDGVLMMYEGALHEAYADPRVQTAVGAFRSPIATDLPSAMSQVTGSIAQADNEWRTAADRFRRALEVEPALIEARVRLGHVLERLGRYNDAVAELERALREGPSEALEYYAQIVLGRAYQAQARIDPAARAFERARALYPGAQSPRLALSEMARDRGDRIAALEALGPIATPRAGADRRDPYWTYHQTHVPGADALIADLRRASVELRDGASVPASLRRPIAEPGRP
jgi:tetratricopeptide (TPR) repeat protein